MMPLRAPAGALRALRSVAIGAALCAYNAAAAAVLKMGPRVFVQTEGAAGCYTMAAGDWFHTPAFQIDAVDTTGAGDVFHGAYIVGMLNGWDLRRVALFASAVAALKCTKLGGRSGIPDMAETLTFLRSRAHWS